MSEAKSIRSNVLAVLAHAGELAKFKTLTSAESDLEFDKKKLSTYLQFMSMIDAQRFLVKLMDPRLESLRLNELPIKISDQFAIETK